MRWLGLLAFFLPTFSFALKCSEVERIERESAKATRDISWNSFNNYSRWITKWSISTVGCGTNVKVNLSLHSLIRHCFQPPQVSVWTACGLMTVWSTSQLSLISSASLFTSTKFQCLSDVENFRSAGCERTSQQQPEEFVIVAVVLK